MALSYSHLHLHTDYSLLDGAISTDVLADRVKSLGQSAVAITDHGTLGGVYKHFQACKKAGVKGIAGIEFYVCDDHTDKEIEKGQSAYDHLTAIAMNEQGWRNLIKLNEIATRDGFYRRPRIDWGLIEKFHEGIIWMGGCIGATIPRLLYEGNDDEAYERARWFKDLVGDRFYLEIMPNRLREQQIANMKLVRLSKKLGIPLVSTSDAHYPKEDDFDSHEVMLAIQTGKKMTDEDRMRFDANDFFIMGVKDITRRYKRFHGDLPKKIVANAIERTCEVTERCEFDLKPGLIRIPLVDTEGRHEYEFLKVLIKRGWKEKDMNNRIRYVAKKKGVSPKRLHKVYKDRIKHELVQIRKKFTRYFLVVWDLMNYAERAKIERGTARGSAASSLVCYLLDITRIDPIEFDLIFERFISPDRVTNPDIDMDFEDERREEIKQYLSERWGYDNVAEIGTYGKLKGKSVVKDVSRALDVPYKDANDVTKYIIERSSGDERASLTVRDSFEQVEACKPFNEAYPDVLPHCERLEGLIRQKGVHAAGVLVGDQPLTNLIPIEYQKGKKKDERQRVSAFEYRDCDALDVLKLDVLGLRTLTIMKVIRKLIKERHGRDIRPEFDIPLDDKKTLDHFDIGETVGVFQFDGIHQEKFCRDAPMTDFEDIVSINALNRPGGTRSGIINQYLARRAGKAEVEKIHPIYDDITKHTRGLIVFQEQVMQIFNRMANYPSMETDSVRKKMAKSHGAEEMERERKRFLKGCSESNVPSDVASRIFDMIVHFGSYGFNRCISSDTVVYRASPNQHRGQEVTVEELYDDWNSKKPIGYKYRNYGVKLLGLVDGKIRPVKCIGVYKTGENEVWEVRTESGKSIKATLDHKFLTDSGWKRLKDISCGEFLQSSDLEYEETVWKPEDGNYTYAMSDVTIEERIERASGASYEGRSGGLGVRPGRGNIMYVNGIWSEFDKNRKELLEEGNYCQNCGCIPERLEVHHKDGNRKNPKKDNLERLCVSCHKKAEYDLGRNRKWSKGYSVFQDRIVSIERTGEEETYDLEIEEPYHNFLANGIVTHNSHAVAYSMISYWMQWFKVHYPTEFFTGLLSYEPDETKIKRIIGVMRDQFGLTVLQPSVNDSKASYTIEGDSIRVGLGKIKYCGAGAIESIVENQPYNDFFDFLERVDRRRVNKRVIESLIKAGAFPKTKDFMPNVKWALENLEYIIKTLKSKKADVRAQVMKEIEASAELEDYGEEERFKVQQEVLVMPGDKHILDYYDEIWNAMDKKWSFLTADKVSTTKKHVVLLRGVVRQVKYTKEGTNKGEEDKAGRGRRMYYHLEDKSGYCLVFLSEKQKRDFPITKLETMTDDVIIVLAQIEPGKDICNVIDMAIADDFRERIQKGGQSLRPFEQNLIKKTDERYKSVMKKFGMIPPKLAAKRRRRKIKVGGFLTKVKPYRAKNGMMAFCTIAYGSHSMEMIVWADGYKKYREHLRVGNWVGVVLHPLQDGKWSLDLRKGGSLKPMEILEERMKSSV